MRTQRNSKRTFIWLMSKQPHSILLVNATLRKSILAPSTDDLVNADSSTNAAVCDIKWESMERVMNLTKYYFWAYLQGRCQHHGSWTASEMTLWDKACRDQARHLAEAVCGLYNNMYLQPHARSNQVMTRAMNMMAFPPNALKDSFCFAIVYRCCVSNVLRLIYVCLSSCCFLLFYEIEMFVV